MSKEVPKPGISPLPGLFTKRCKKCDVHPRLCSCNYTLKSPKKKPNCITGEMSIAEESSPNVVPEKHKIVPMPWLFDKCKECDQILNVCKCSLQLKNTKENARKSKSNSTDKSMPKMSPLPWLFTKRCKKCDIHPRLCSCPKENNTEEKPMKRKLDTEEVKTAPIFDTKASGDNIRINIVPSTPPLRPPSSKRSKMLPIKKELFKKPNEKKKSVMPNMVKTRNNAAKKTPLSSPLVSIEEVEEKLINNEVSTFSNDNLKVLTKSVTKSDTQSDDSQNDFLLNEQQCLMESPVSSVCNLLKGTNIDSAKKTYHHSSDPIATIQAIIEEEIIEFNKYKIAHEHRIQTLKNIISIMKGDSKENTPKRRSLRLAVRNSPLLRKNVVSPAIKRSEDLRKKALTKNLTTTLSPKAVGALSAFKDYEVQKSYLETPKSDKNKNMGFNTLYEQMYNLQDTPAHGK